MSQRIAIPWLKTTGDLQNGLRVRVYWNLHRRCWSVKHKDKVICHTLSVWLADPKPVVSEKGRQRVIAEKRKNVHAYIEGTITPDPVDSFRQFCVKYNPYEAGHFQVEFTGEKWVPAEGDIINLHTVAPPDHQTKRGRQQQARRLQRRKSAATVYGPINNPLQKVT